MSVTQSLRKQHAEMVEVVRQIDAGLDPQRLAASAGEIRNRLSALLGKLTMHLAVEDNSLYPSLEKHANPKVREIGSKFAREMAAVKPSVEAFGKKWTETAIAKDAAGFCAEAKKLFGVLGDRIKRENSELYPLLEDRA
ncbi:MAG TPA: hemerythrin domain-containing protein [Stellaceae bacterium]|nr:hemerythrin domain-containing protein [Stellaceae bacterium]